MSAAPTTREELEQTAFFQAGARARQNRVRLAEAISCLRPGCWQYDAFIEGYDSKKRQRAATQPSPAKSTKGEAMSADGGKDTP